jgi:predicted TIM-barrel fold metal-dependent hydrolase
VPEYRLISADSHVNEVPATWERVQKKHGDRAPRIVWNPSESEVGPYLVIEGWTPGPSGRAFKEDCWHEYVGLAIGGLNQELANQWKEATSGTFSGAGSSNGKPTSHAAAFRERFRFEDYPGPGWDPAPRMSDQDRDGVDAEVLYPSHLRHFYELSARDEPFFHDIIDSYNEWVLDFASFNPRRLIAQPVISVLNPSGAAADIRRYAARGAKGFIMASSVPEGMSYGDTRFDLIWEAAQECNAPLAMHTSTGRWKQPKYGFDQARRFIGPQAEIQVTLAEMIFGGTFDRFPRLKVVSAEFDIGWVGHVAQRFRARDSRLGLELAPADYLERNVWFTFQDDRAGCLTAPMFGANNFLWASDYPHGATTWPDSHAILERQFEGLDKEIMRKVGRQNAVDLYGLDLPA